MQNVKGAGMVKVAEVAKASEVTTLKCQKHGIEFQGRLLLNRIQIGCPKCREEDEQKLREREEAKIKAKNEELQRFKDFRIKHSGLPKKLIETKAKYTQNFRQFSEHLIELKNNLFLCGGVGTGKTMYCAELIKRNTEKYPMYFLACDLAYLSNTKKQDFIKSLDICELFILDEISDIGLIDESFFNLVVDKLYNQDSIIVLSGNVKNDYLNSLSLKVLSRLNANGLSICEFNGNDLRVKK